MGWLKVLSLLAAVQLSSLYLLPGDITPSHYDLRLIYDVDPASNFSFFGVVDILLTAKKNTSKIILHAAVCSISEDKVIVVSQNDAPKVTGVNINATYNFLEIALDSDLKENKNYTLIIPFYGNLFIGLDGVYISTYFNSLIQKTEYLIATQFQPISARKGFPCFDEPIYKATFSINIGHSKDYTAVSNMPLVVSSFKNAIENYWPWETVGKKFDKEQSTFTWDQFEKSVPMSTYLVAFVVSKFSHVVSPPELSHAKFRIWARSDAIDQVSYSSRIGPAVLSHFEKWFNVTFPLPKQDMMAIPDFVAEGMENWGLITYEETALLYHNKESSLLDKERIAELVAHELAHQWFGNLVTMKWWSDLWLNEGFATFVASLGVSAAEPDWHADHHNAVENTLAVLRLDALASSHPVSVSLNDLDAISEIFDDISYSKGASLIRMMLMFLGEDAFRQALHGYLVKYSYSNAEQDDLWLELTTVALQKGRLSPNMTVKEVMDTWTKQTGYPLITVNRNYSDNSLTISQKRYVSLGGNDSTSSWWIPLSVMCEVEMEKKLQWLGKTEGVSDAQGYKRVCGPNEWVLFNYNMIAPYRVNYDQRNWQLLTKTLTSDKYTAIPIEGRVQLLSDALELAWNNQLDYGMAMQLVSYLQRETEYLPLHTGLFALSKIDNVLKRCSDYGIFQKFVRTLINNVYQKGGLALKKIVNGDNLSSVKFQTIASGWACSMNIPECEENAIKMYSQWMETENPDENNPISVDLRSIVYCVGISRGGVLQWSWALMRMRRSLVASARERLLHALACSRDVWLQAKLLEWTVTETAEIRRQDSSRIISAVISSDTIASGWACSMNIPECEENAIKMYSQWMETENPDENNPISVDLRSIVYCVGISRGGVLQWSWALMRMRRSLVASARERLLHALACSRDVWLQAKLLEWTVTETAEIRRQDSSRIISAVISSDTIASGWACSMNIPECEENAIKMYSQWMETENPDENNPISVDLRSIVYCVGISRGGVLQWSWALMRMRRSLVASARERLLHALACSRDVWLQAKLLEWTVTETAEIRRQDSSRIISAVISSDVGFYVARDFIYNRIEDVYNAFQDKDESIGDIIKNLLVQFTTLKELDEFLVWQEKNAKYYSDSKIAVAQGIEVARVNIAWVENMKPSFIAKLKENFVEN